MFLQCVTLLQKLQIKLLIQINIKKNLIWKEITYNMYLSGDLLNFGFNNHQHFFFSTIIFFLLKISFFLFKNNSIKIHDNIINDIINININNVILKDLLSFLKIIQLKFTITLSIIILIMSFYKNECFVMFLH